MMTIENKKQKLNTQPYKGARDFFPEDMRVRNYIFDTWRKVCKKYSYQEYDFPILEPFEIFAAKTGEEIVNTQLFSFTDGGGRKIAIRPELTPGTVRMLAQKYKELTMPVRWFMVGQNYRYEKPQKGRGREFFQLEVNIFGVDSVLADFEIFTIVIDIMTSFGADETMFEVLVSDRRLISCLLNETLNLTEEKSLAARRLMDKRSKVTKEEFFEMLAEIELLPEQAKTIENFMQSNLESLAQVIPQEILTRNEGYQAISQLFNLLAMQNLGKYCRFAPSIIRGFDYSDGLVYEVFDKNPDNNRSLYGGERFDKLINIFGDFDLPATGFAMGDMPLLEFLKGWNLLPSLEPALDYFVTLWPTEDIQQNQKYLLKSLEVAKLLREKGFSVESEFEQNTRLDKQLKAADKKNAKNVIIIGEEELKENKVTIKDLQTGKQETKALIEFI